jgi:outer membrane lipoprotein SlyB
MTGIRFARRGTFAFSFVAATVLAACADPGPPRYATPYDPPPPAPYETRGSVAPDNAYNSGVVTSIDVLRASGPSAASPVGAIAGAVIGGLLGNQIGAGGGRALATGAGVVGGALAGNEIGRRAEAGGAPDIYRIGIQFDGGGSQFIDLRDPAGLRVGERVRVDGGGQISRY